MILSGVYVLPMTRNPASGRDYGINLDASILGKWLPVQRMIINNASYHVRVSTIPYLQFGLATRQHQSI
jgi:hypothetical protein